MPGEDRAGIEERNAGFVAGDDLGWFAALGDPAEQARRSGHAALPAGLRVIHPLCRVWHDDRMADDDPPARGWRGSLSEEMRITSNLIRWVVLGIAIGCLAGVAGYVFLEGLDRVTSFRLDHGWLVWLLPVAGLVIGLAYHYIGGRSAEGNALLIEEIHEPTTWVPRRMAPLVLIGSWVTHLFGGSAGREGTALQMSGSLTDGLARALRLSPADRRLALVASIGGGFGAVFGVPLAGAVFALEVQAIGRVRYEALVPALTASIVGDLVVGGLGYHHSARVPVIAGLSTGLVLKVAVAGVAFGAAGLVFTELAHRIQALVGRVGWPPLRQVIGGVGIVGLFILFGSDYLGLSLPLVDRALDGDRLGFAVFALKLLFTAVTLGCGLPGGEVTPLLVVGATLGAALATPLHLPVTLLAAVGYLAVFGGASNTPLACTIMGAEIFGAGAVVPFAVGCVVAYVCSGHRSIYVTQRIAAGKGGALVSGLPRVGDRRH